MRFWIYHLQFTIYNLPFTIFQGDTVLSVVNQATVTFWDCTLFYRRAKELSAEEMQSFIVSAKTPRPGTLAEFGYQQTEHVGVYHSDNVLLVEIPLLVLNELDDKPYNVFFKLFASRAQAKMKAVSGLKRWWLSELSEKLYWLIRGLLKLWFIKGEQMMEAITPDLLIEQGKIFKDLLMPMMTPEEIEAVLQDTPYAQQIREAGREEGWEEGREIGREEGADLREEKLVVNMLKNKLSPEDISRYTGLAIERIHEIKKKHNL